MSAEPVARGLFAALIVLAAALCLEIGYGAALGDALLYVGYELGFVVAPGWLAYRVLTGTSEGPLRQLAMGWALGYVLEVLAFMLTAAIHARGLFVAYPLVIVALAAPTLIRRREVFKATGAEARLPAHFWWPLVLVCLIAMTYIALSFFSDASLPGAANAVNYFPDDPRWISLAAEAKHHWPILDPSVSGEPLPYHYFVNIHMAAASQATGIGLPVVYFRLFIFPLVVLLVLELVVAAQTFARSAYVGLVAAILAFCVGQLRLDASHSFLAHNPFFGLFFTFLFRSPSFLFGLVLFVPLITLLGDRFAAKGTVGRPGTWLLVTLFMIGASDAKVSILPLVIVAIFLYAGWRWLVERRIPLAVSIAGALALLVAGTVYVLQYKGHSSRLGVHLFTAVDGMTAVSVIKGELMRALPGFPAKETVLSAGGIVFGLFGLLAAQLIGLVWILRRQGRHLSAGQAWLFSILGAGVVMSLTLNEPGTVSALYFVCYGLAAGVILSATGLRLAWASRPALAGRAPLIAVCAVVWLAILAGLVAAPSGLHLFSGPQSFADTYIFWYAGLLVSLILLFAVARRWIGPTRWAAAALVCAALVVVGALDTPIDSLEPAIVHSSSTKPLYGKLMSRQLFGALTWIRRKTPTDSVIAVNNQWLDRGDTIPLEFRYSAFAERRVFLEGWGYSQRTIEGGYSNLSQVNPFADRLRMNKAAFAHGDRGALQTMSRRYGVRYLVVDEVNGYRADLRALSQVSRPVYSATGVLILELR